MGKRSGVAETRAELAKLSLETINREIERCLSGATPPGTRQGRKSYFERLVWLEAEREVLHDIPAPQRRFKDLG